MRLIELHFGKEVSETARKLFRVRQASRSQLHSDVGLAKLVEMDLVHVNDGDQFVLSPEKVFCLLLRSSEYSSLVTALHGVKGAQTLTLMLQKGRAAAAAGFVKKGEELFAWLDHDGLDVLEEGVFASQLLRMYQTDGAFAPAIAETVKEVLSLCGPSLYRVGHRSFSAEDVTVPSSELVALQQRGSRPWLVQESEGKFSLSLKDVLWEPVERLVKEAVDATCSLKGASIVFTLLSLSGPISSKDLARQVLMSEAETRRVLNKLLADGWVRAAVAGGTAEKKHVQHLYAAIDMVEAVHLLIQKQWSTLLRVIVKLTSLHEQPLIEKAKVEKLHAKAEEIYSTVNILKKCLKTMINQE